MRTLFKATRITLLLAIFVALAFYTKTQRLKSQAWTQPLQVVIYPMNSSTSPEVEEYISQLNSVTFSEIDSFFQSEAEQYELSLAHPTQTILGPSLDQLPPVAPEPSASFAKIAWWGLKFRYWSYTNTPDNDSNLHRVRVFLHYHEIEENKQLRHSLGLQKGLLAIVHAFAAKSQEAQNNIIIAHELLHTVGATDKYDSNKQAVFPHGYAEPDKSPLFPQSLAEIMAVTIPASPTESNMASSLAQCIIGNKTAEEINWLQVISNK